MQTETTPEVPAKLAPVWMVFSQDETEHFRIEPEDAPFIERILAVYIYNASETTNCCEIIPSYDMIGVYHTVHTQLGVECDDATRDRLDETYAHEGLDDCYMHVSAVESVIKTHGAKRCVPFGEHTVGGEPFWKDEEDQGEEFVREHIQGNPPF